MTKMTDSELSALVEQEAANALGYTGKLTAEREKALEYYFAKPTGDLLPPEIEGRSSVVSPDVANAVEWAMPGLMRIFTSGEDIAQFDARKPGDEAKAQLATDYCNYLLWTQNHGFRIVYWWIKDALLSKNGFIKVYGEKEVEITEEDYTGLTFEQLAPLVAPDDVEVLEQSSEPDEADQTARNMAEAQAMQMEMQGNIDGALQIRESLLQTPPVELYSIKIKRTCDKMKVCVDNVPPEEMLVSRLAKSVTDTPFIAHRVRKTLGELIAMGFDKKKVEDLASNDNWKPNDGEAVERASYDDEYQPWNDDDSQDPLMRSVWLLEAYIKCDYEGKDELRWLKVFKAGSTILEKEEVDEPPFADMTPIMMPHRAFGLSLADITMDWEKIKTSILRQYLDALYLANNPRHSVIEGQVNLDDMLLSRPGGLVRVKQLGAIAPIVTQDISQSAIGGLEYFDKITEERNGVLKFSGGLDENALHPTATGVNAVERGQQQRMELVARVFAEVGFRRLFQLLLKCATRYQDKAAMVRISGKFVEINPQEWKDGFDMTITVGLSTGNQDAQAIKINNMIGLQERLLGLGITTPMNIYNSVKKLPNVLGFKDGEQFFTQPDPSKPLPNPGQAQAQQAMQEAQLKAQTEERIATMQAQFAAQKAQGDAQLQAHIAQIKAQAQAEVDRNRQASEAQQHGLKIQQEAELAQLKMQYEDAAHQRDIAFQQWKQEGDWANKIETANISSKAKVDNEATQAATAEMGREIRE